MVDAIQNILLKFRKRPALFVFTAMATLFFCILEQYNVLTKDYGTWSKLFGDNYLTDLNSLVEKLGLTFRNPSLLLILFLFTVLLLVSISAILGFSYSGFFHQMLCASEGEAKAPAEMRTGISRHFVKLSLFFLASIPATIIFVALFLYTLVPSVLSIMYFFTGSSSIFFPMLAICILTILVDVFALIFYAMYISFIIPALFSFQKGGVGVAFRMVNAYCWYLLPRTLAFLALNLGLRVLLLFLHYGWGSGALGIFLLIGTWVIRTIIDTCYLHFVFNTFSAMKSDMYEVVE
ncbi:MAG: hypothetical protein IKU26_01970 [Clostridia bacterium]|nr:hypothetical protein [Clostridia bacterium]